MGGFEERPKTYRVVMRMVSEVEWIIEAPNKDQALELAKAAPMEWGNEDIVGTSYKARLQPGRDNPITRDKLEAGGFLEGDWASDLGGPVKHETT
jgi:hypothetical protein